MPAAALTVSTARRVTGWVQMARQARVCSPEGSTMDAVAGRRAALGLVLWCAALAAATALFHTLGRGALAAPPLDPGAWAGWADGRDPLVASVTVLRLVTLALCWYLAGATAIGIVARVTRGVRLVRLADAVTVPALRRLLHTALGLSFAAVMVAPVVGPRVDPDRVVLGADAAVTVAAGQPADPAPEVGGLAVVGGGGGDSAFGAPEEPGGGGTGDRLPPGMVPPLGLLDGAPPDSPVPLAPSPPPVDGFGAGTVTDAAEGASDAADGTSGSTSHGASGGAVAEAADVGDGRTHEVVPGDSFWRIAEQRLWAHHDRQPTDEEVAHHMDRLIEHNRGRLVDRANPDLIFPGQRLVLPAMDGDR